MAPDANTTGKIKELLFTEESLSDQEEMLHKLDFLIHAWGRELLQKGYLQQIPQSDHEWKQSLDMDIYWGDLKDSWEHYVVGCLIFFVMLRADIRRDFLLQPDNIRSQRLGRWLQKLRHYMNPLLKNTVTEFCLRYGTITERRPIRVRFCEFS